MNNKLAILVVEDEQLALSAIVHHLQEVGFNVYEATNADDAIKLLERHNDIQVVFTDVVMPGSMDGIKLAAFVSKRWPPIKIVVISGHPLSTFEAIPDGAMFVEKPYPYENMTRMITRLAASYRS